MRTVRPREERKTWALAGGFAGLLTYVVFGLMPSIVYGGFAGTVLAHGLVGHGQEGTLAKVIVFFGMIVGGLSMSSIFVILGAVVGAAGFGLIHVLPERRIVGNGDEPSKKEASS